MADSHQTVISEAKINNNDLDEVLKEISELSEVKKVDYSVVTNGHTVGDNLRTKISNSATNDVDISRTGVDKNTNGEADVLSQTTPIVSRNAASLVRKGLSFSEGLRGKKNAESKIEFHGFVLVSWKIRQFLQLENALRPGKFLFYPPVNLSICLNTEVAQCRRTQRFLTRVNS